MAGAQCIPGIQTYDLAQAPAHTIALDRISDLFRNGEADPDRAGVSAVTRLQDEVAAGTLIPPAAARKSARCPRRSIAITTALRPSDSGAQAFAAAGTARGDDLFFFFCGRSTVAMRARKPWRRLRTSLLG